MVQDVATGVGVEGSWVVGPHGASAELGFCVGELGVSWVGGFVLGGRVGAGLGAAWAGGGWILAGELLHHHPWVVVRAA